MDSEKMRKGQFNRIVPFLFLTILSQNSCREHQKNQETFGVGLSYNLDRDEKIFLPVKTASESFKYIASVGEIRLLMNKAFVAPKSKTFISFLSDNTRETLFNAHFDDTTISVIDSSVTGGSYAVVFSKGPFFVFRHMLPENKHHLKMVLDVMSTDSLFIDQIYRDKEGFIAEKISHHEN
jgi:hypothetical protein